ncbi:MlaD family protein [Desulfosediminicola flagellatus]|uniref:MlaD family protein n=1 Tax=Desulfosediminicola flagellatus TaxID=2569541 RepID=UPI0010AC2B16|nr:MlaD family protein [Desulfosediminicola flagellatus]
MAKQANTTMIGGFIVIAVFIFAASVVILGSGKFFQRTERFVLYFDNSIKGLNVGAPVLLQGVQIGSVTNILIRANPQDLTMSIPVFIDIRQDKFDVGETIQPQRDPAKTIAQLAERGLRAVLSTQSLITGQLMIELDYFPNSPVNLKNLDSEFTEIPTIQSTTERLFQKLQKIDLAHFSNIIVGVDRLVNNPDLPEGLKSMRQTADEARLLVGKLDNYIGDVTGNIEDTLSDTRTLVNNVNTQVEPLVDDMRQLIEHFDSLTRNINKQLDVVSTSLNESLAGVKGVVSEDAQLVIELEETLQNISSMTDSIRQLADYLEQHPEALIRGKDNN